MNAPNLLGYLGEPFIWREFHANHPVHGDTRMRFVSRDFYKYFLDDDLLDHDGLKKMLSEKDSEDQDG